MQKSQPSFTFLTSTYHAPGGDPKKSPNASKRTYWLSTLRYQLQLRPSTFFGNLKLAALGDLDSILRLVAGVLGDVLDLVHDVVAFEDFAEDDVPAVEPGGDGGRDEELGAVGVLAGVGHACCEERVCQRGVAFLASMASCIGGEGER